MAMLHVATLTPSKLELIGAWLPTRSWAPTGEVELIGAYRFDDPEGAVGMEAHLVRCGGEVVHVPLSYRSAPIDGGDAHLVGTLQHSVLGERWVYDGVADPVCARMLAAAAMTGSGQAVSMVERDGRWMLVPSPVRLSGGGWSDERVALDGFGTPHDAGSWSVAANDRFELRVARRPAPGHQAAIALTATWAGQADAVVLAEVRELNG